ATGGGGGGRGGRGSAGSGGRACGGGRACARRRAGVTRLRQRSRAGGLVELVVIVAVALGLALLIQAFLVKPYRIPSESMEPTLDVGQRVLVNRIGTHFGDPSVGDILVFHPPQGAEGGGTGQCGVAHPEAQACPRPTAKRANVNFIKRVVGVPGDR